jgi:hypothetical protein
LRTLVCWEAGNYASYRLKRPNLMLAILEAAFLMSCQSLLQVCANSRAKIPASVKREELRERATRVLIRTWHVLDVFHPLKLL